MSWCWLALIEDWPREALAAAAVSDVRGAPAGVLAAWPRGVKPRRHARRIDARAIDPTGAEATASLVLPPPGVRLPFDDPAVQQARRMVLARPPFDALSTLLTDASHFEGALTVARGDDVARLADDPFGRVLPARVLRIDAGLLGHMPWPAGPVIERYGSTQPWPWDRFAHRT